MDQTAQKGLSAAEVAQRLRLGQVNCTPRKDWLDYANIVNRNLFTWFNAMVAPACIALVYLKEYQPALAVSAIAISNATIGLVQEIRAKHHLDKLAILVESRARVLRDGQVQEIPAGDVVLGDHVLLQAGETIVADGPLLQAQFLEVDEALLTGESDPVRRQEGEQLLSGSFCITGQGLYRADKVGSAAFANRTSLQARRYHFVASPLTNVINRIVQILSYTAIGLSLLYSLTYFLHDYPQTAEYVKMVAATITSMVPQGLVLTATVSFTLGAVVMSRRGAVVQRLNAVETMAAVDVVCTDKTGTLTTNRLKLDQIRILQNAPLSPPGRGVGGEGTGQEEVRRLLRLFVSASVDRQNKNLQALRAALGETQVELLDQVPFKSQNRYSAVRVRDGEAERVLVLGAVEALGGREAWWDQQEGHNPDGSWQKTVAELQATGLRLLLFAAMEPPRPFNGSAVLPEAPLRPLALVALSDELRPEAGQVLEALAAQGIDFKVLSGDNPETVRATVSHLHLPLARQPVVSGAELAQAADKAELIARRSVFGRVSPEQKVEIVDTLRRQGRHVAMIGDGVNDVLPIKRADLGIAMGEGSQASKTVAGLVLENNNFALLPETLEEGRTIVRNLRRCGKLFLVKNVYSLILILAYYLGVGSVPFPYEPQQVTLLNWLVIGLPALVIAVSRERSTAATRPRFLREVGWFALRSGVIFGLAGLLVLFLAGLAGRNGGLGEPATEKLQRTMLLSTLILLGITALFRALTDGESQPLVGDTRFRLLGIVAVPVYLLVMYADPIDFFRLQPLGVREWFLVLAVVGLAYWVSRWSDRWPGARGQGPGARGEGRGARD